MSIFKPLVFDELVASVNMYYWIERGHVAAQQKKPGVPYAITITAATDRALREWVATSSRISNRSQTQIA